MMLLHSFSFMFTAVLLEHFLGLNPHAAWHLGGKKTRADKMSGPWEVNCEEHQISSGD